MRPLLYAVLFMVVAFSFAFAGTVSAQELPDWMNTPGVSPDEVNTVAEEIWCPLCSGVRLDSCELRACHQMKDVIALKLAEGESTEAIKEYFLEQYGPQVLGEPPREGFNWLAWILPFVAVALGGVFLWRQSQRLVRPSSKEPGSTEASAHEHRGHSLNGASTSMDARDRNDAERRLDEELAKYG
jgi:cytochrome c-type biogenesis protein CcmH/NrfF